ncbi:Fic family protein [Candidatus Uhrbacteria bacterium]|nr:Fic family protein [Candidatus Uhrbacteria bacterium]
MRVAIENEASPEKKKDGLRRLMSEMSALAREIPPEKSGNEDAWRRLTIQFNNIIMDKGKVKPEIKKIYDDVLDEYSQFIDSEFVMRAVDADRYSASRRSVEDLSNKIYGRSPEDVEKLKERNRAKAVQEILRLKEAPSIELDDILKLHAANNSGIVPAELSQLRDKDAVNFGKQVGILPGEDLKIEMQDLMDRVNDTINKAKLENWSDARYAVAVAKLQAEFVQIHPFLDRNGSTGLLLAEAMMAKRGYEPSTKRQSFHDNLRDTLGYIGSAVFRGNLEDFATRRGYYPGRTTQGKNQQILYQAYLNANLGAETPEEKKQKKPLIGRLASMVS